MLIANGNAKKYVFEVRRLFQRFLSLKTIASMITNVIEQGLFVVSLKFHFFFQRYKCKFLKPIPRNQRDHRHLLSLVRLNPRRKYGASESIRVDTQNCLHRSYKKKTSQRYLHKYLQETAWMAWMRTTGCLHICANTKRGTRLWPRFDVLPSGNAVPLPAHASLSLFSTESTRCHFFVRLLPSTGLFSFSFLSRTKNATRRRKESRLNGTRGESRRDAGQLMPLYRVQPIVSYNGIRG